MHNDELAHYGVKGMKWGKRKVDSAHQKVESYDKMKSLDYEAKALKSGKSSAEAKLIAQRKVARDIKVRKVMLVAAGTTLAAVAAYGTGKYLNQNFRGVNLDTSVKLSNINGVGAGRDLNRHLYVSYKKSDKLKYKGFLSKEYQLMAQYPLVGQKDVSGRIYKTTLAPKSNIKAPSNHEAKKVFAKIKKNNPELKGVSYSKLSNGLATDAHGVRGEFFNELSKKGYNAIQDYNDQRVTGYKSSRPLILFNAAKNTKVADVRELDIGETQAAFVKASARKAASKLPVAAVKVGGAGAAVKVYSKNKKLQSKQARIDAYKKANPGTKKSDAEIYNMLKRRGPYYVVKEPKE